MQTSKRGEQKQEQDQTAQRDPSASAPIDPEIADELWRLQARAREMEHEIFDLHQWIRKQQKVLGEEIKFLRSISLEYKLLDFVRRQIERSTGIVRKPFEYEADQLKVSLVAIPDPKVPASFECLQLLTAQTHPNWEVVAVADPASAEQLKRFESLPTLRVQLVDASWRTAAKFRVGFETSSGDICGFFSHRYALYPAALSSVALFFAATPSAAIGHSATITAPAGLWQVPSTPLTLNFRSALETDIPDLECFFFRKSALQRGAARQEQLARLRGVSRRGEHALDQAATWFEWRFEEGWDFHATLKLLRRFNSLLIPYTVTIKSAPENGLSAESDKRAQAKKQILEVVCQETWKLQRLRQRVRHRFVTGKAKLLKGPKPRFWYPSQASNRTGSAAPLDELAKCPITAKVADSFMFSLVTPSSAPQILSDVFYHSKTKVAVLCSKSLELDSSEADLTEIPQYLEGDAPLSPKPQKSSLKIGGLCRAQSTSVEWFYSPVQNERYADLANQPRPLSEEKEKPPEVALTQRYEQAVTALLPAGNFSRVLEIVDSRYSEFGADSGTPFTTGLVKRDIATDSWFTIADLKAFWSTDLAGVVSGDYNQLFDLMHPQGVLQTCRRPRQVLRMLGNLLRWGSLVLVSLPNLDSRQLELAGPAWCHWRPGVNAFIYGRESLRSLMRHCGFEEVAVSTFSHPAWSRRTAANLCGSPSSARENDPIDAPRIEALADRLAEPSAGALSGDYLVALFRREY